METFPELFKRILVHQDIRTYASGLRGKVTTVIATALEVLDAAYVQLKDFPANAAALTQLDDNTESYTFERFNNI